LGETLHVEVFCKDGSVFLNQLPRFLVLKIVSGVEDIFVNLSQYPDRFASTLYSHPEERSFTPPRI